MKKNIKSYPSAAVRIRVMKRDRFKCTYCGIPGTDAELEIDHIIPVSKGGSNHISNLTTACRKCNQQKRDKISYAPAICNTPKNHSIIGMFLHTFNSRQEIEHQGRIVGETTNEYLIELFSFSDGLPTNIITITKAEIFNENIKLYASQANWHNAYCKYTSAISTINLSNIEKYFKEHFSLKTIQSFNDHIIFGSFLKYLRNTLLYLTIESCKQHGKTKRITKLIQKLESAIDSLRCELDNLVCSEFKNISDQDVCGCYYGIDTPKLRDKE
jgi:hypothetical protein